MQLETYEISSLHVEEVEGTARATRLASLPHDGNSHPKALRVQFNFEGRDYTMRLERHEELLAPGYKVSRVSPDGTEVLTRDQRTCVSVLKCAKLNAVLSQLSQTANTPAGWKVCLQTRLV